MKFVSGIIFESIPTLEHFYTNA